MTTAPETLDGAAMLVALGVTAEPPPSEDPEHDAGLAEFAPETTYNPVESASGVVAVPPEFVCQRSVLAAMVEQVMLAVPTRDFYPALKAVVIDVTEDALTLTGSNSAISVISTSLAVRTLRPGRVLVSGAKFAAAVRHAVGVEVRVAVSASSVHIVSGGRSWTLRVPGTQEYDPPLELGDLTWIEVDRTAFDRAIVGTRYAAGSDVDRDQYMQIDLSGGLAVASDGVRYAQVAAALPAELSSQVAVAGVDLVTKMLANNAAEQFRLAESAYHTVVEIGPPEAPDRAVIAHLHQPLPSEARGAIAGPRGANRDRCVIDAAELLAALSAARVTQDTETGAVLLRVSARELTVESRNRYGDCSTETIECLFTTPGSEREPKPRPVSVVRDHLVKAVRAAQRATVGGSDEDDEEPLGAAEVVLLLGEDRSKSRPAPILVQDVSETTQAVLTQVRSEWLS